MLRLIPRGSGKTPSSRQADTITMAIVSVRGDGQASLSVVRDNRGLVYASMSGVIKAVMNLAIGS